MVTVSWTLSSTAMDIPIDDFPLNYSQNIRAYLPNTALEQQSKLFYKHYFSNDEQGLSPWSKCTVTLILPEVKHSALEELEAFDNTNQPVEKRHYAENFQEKDPEWIRTIEKNIDLTAMDQSSFNLHIYCLSQQERNLNSFILMKYPLFLVSIFYKL